MQIKIETISSLPIVFMRRIGAYGEQNYQLMKKMKEWVQERGLWSNEGVIYGIAQDNAETTTPENCRYDVCFVTESTLSDNNVQKGVLPSGKYLISKIPHTSEAVQQFYATLTEILLKEEMQYDLTRPILERYHFAIVETGYCEFCVPII